MPNARKELVVSDLKELVEKSSGAILTEYRGLTVAEISTLRRRLRTNGSEYHVVKNTLYRIALGSEESEKLGSLLTGPTAVLFSTEDVVGSAKTMTDFLRELRRPDIKIKGAYIDGKIYNADQVASIAKLPPKEQIVSQLIGSLNAPASNFVGTLSNIIGDFVRTVQAIADQKAEGTSAAA